MNKPSTYQIYKNNLLEIMDTLVSIIIFLVAVRLMIYMITSLYATVEDMFTGELWIENKTNELLHWIVYFIVMVKAYKVLIAYAKYHKVSLKDITELVIVTTFIEIIFQMQELSVMKIAVLGSIGILTLVVYLYYYDRFVEITLSNKNSRKTTVTSAQNNEDKAD